MPSENLNSPESVPDSKRTVGLFFDDGSWIQAYWCGKAWVSADRAPLGGKKSPVSGWLEMPDAVELAKSRNRERQA